MKNISAPKDFKGRLAKLVKESDMDYRPLAAAIGISQASLSKYTRGDAEPGLGALVKLADYFNVSTDYLAGRTDTKSPNADLQGIVNLTGLSEVAVEALLSPVKDGWEGVAQIKLEVLSKLIGQESFQAQGVFGLNFDNWSIACFRYAQNPEKTYGFLKHNRRDSTVTLGGDEAAHYYAAKVSNDFLNFMEDMTDSYFGLPEQWEGDNSNAKD